MGCEAIIQQIESAGLFLQAIDSSLHIRPREKITDDIRALIREHKQEILALLRIDLKKATRVGKTETACAPEVQAFIDSYMDGFQDYAALRENQAVPREWVDGFATLCAMPLPRRASDPSFGAGTSCTTTKQQPSVSGRAGLGSG